MRTKTLILAAAALAVGLASSMAQTVYSVNVVGYVNRAIPANPSSASLTFAFIGNPLDTGNNVLTNLFQSLPVNSKVLKWNYSKTGFDTYTRVALGAGWSPTGAGLNTLNLGEGCAVEMPVGNLTGTNVTFVGTVFQGSMTNTFLPGYSLQSYPVPLQDAVTNVQTVNLNAYLPATPANSKLLRWNETLQNGYATSTRVSLGSGWSPSVPTNYVATSFFIFNNGTTNRAWNIAFTVQ